MSQKLAEACRFHFWSIAPLAEACRKCPYAIVRILSAITIRLASSPLNAILFTSEELVLAMVTASEQDDDCDLCSMFGTNECYLHRTTELYGMETVFRDLVTNVDRKSDVTLHHEGLAFRSVFATSSNRWVLFIKGVSEVDD